MSNPSPLSSVQQVIARWRQEANDQRRAAQADRVSKVADYRVGVAYGKELCADDLEAVMASLPQPEEQMDSVERIYCDGCLAVQPLVRAYMPADARNDHPATDLLCGECRLVIATLHHPAASLPSGWQPPIIEDMRRASALCDEADGPAECQMRLVGLAMIAREFLRSLPPAPAGEGQKGTAHGE
jgi:hypothetical protein